MNIDTLDLLREALPYIQNFQGKTFVIKFSGKVTENKDNLASLADYERWGIETGNLSRMVDPSAVADTTFVANAARMLNAEKKQ